MASGDLRRERERKERRPNVLLVMADQLRADALGRYGNRAIRTPVIDGLAERGVRFERMFAAYPVCAPNRASIVTGRYPTVHRLRANGMRLPACELRLMEVLRQAGYVTYGAGKMHFGAQWAYPADGGERGSTAGPGWTVVSRGHYLPEEKR
jgi:arylsulfatase